jgi:hypothetical protein
METTMRIQQEAIPLVKSSLELKRKALEFNLNEYRRRLAAYETQHKMNSQEFIKKFKTGELGDDAAWFDWEFALDALDETEHQLVLLASVKL